MGARDNPFVRMIGLVWVVGFFAVFCFLALRGLYADYQFDQNALRSRGTVERNWTTSGTKGGAFYHVSYHFTDNHGRIWAVSNVTSQATYRSVHMGTVVPVKFFAIDPQQSRIDLPEETRYQWHQHEILLGIALVLGGIWALVFFTARR